MITGPRAMMWYWFHPLTLRTPRSSVLSAIDRDRYHVVPVGITIDGPYIYIAGLDNARTRKYRNVRRDPRVAMSLLDRESGVPLIRCWATACRV